MNKNYIKIKSIKANMENYGLCEADGKYVTADAELEYKKDTILVKASAECIPEPYSWCNTFKRDNAMCITLETEEITEYLGEYSINPNWIRPTFGQNIAEESKELQFLLLNCKDYYVFALPVTNDRFHTTIRGCEQGIQLCVNMLYGGACEVSGTVAVLGIADDPYSAVKKAFAEACGNFILTPLKEDKQYPEVLNKLGWCTWNAFMHDVSEEKIFTKLEEFKTKNIPVKWVLIDDGWSETEGLFLKSIYEDKTKFPNGLKNTISIMKSLYGIEKVGIWHSMTGYWFGIDFESENTILSWQNRKVPSGYEFYSKWHRYLKEQGVDFLKVDTQGNLTEFLTNQKAALSLLRNIYEGLEKSASENFEFMINCMGMKSTNSFQHRSSVLMRNSDDFYPEKVDGFYNHAVDNIYNAIFQSEMFYCDYDMWWSKHFAAKQNAVLRFMSGGPVYLSDELGNSDDTYIKLFCDKNGIFKRPDTALRPTCDCVFGFDKVLKAFTKIDNKYVVAAFTFDSPARFEISAEDFGKSGNYKVRELFSGETNLMKENNKMNVEMPSDDAAVYFFEETEGM